MKNKGTTSLLRAPDPEGDLRHRVNAGRAAVESQVAFFHQQMGNVKSSWKEDETRVTFADFAISEKIFAALRRDFPGDHFCSEESNPQDEEMQLSATYTWVLDPIDGTNNFALGLPLACISLALLREGEPVYGFIYDGCRRALLHGGPGRGLWEGHRKVTEGELVREETPEKEMSISLHFPLTEAELALFEPLIRTCRVRSLGTSALALLTTALGQLDGFIDFDVKVWDVAAALALCRAVGVEPRFPQGSPFPLRRFHPRMGPCPLVAGSPAFLERVKNLAWPAA